MPGQVAKPPFVVGQEYLYLSKEFPNFKERVTYDSIDEHGRHIFHRVQEPANEGFLTVDTADPNYGMANGMGGFFIGYTGNAGGRRKSRRSKRSKRSHRKTKRRY
jgi:hypothetical protein